MPPDKLPLLPAAPQINRRLLIAAGASALSTIPVGHAQAGRPAVPETPQTIAIRSFPITSFNPRNPSEIRFGQLEFRGGLELQSSYAGFGGLSSIRMDAAGQRMTGVTDAGQWLTARLDRDGTRPTGLSDARMAAILGPQGRPLADTRDHDCEGLWIEGGTALVSVEGTNRIFRFETFGRDGITARGLPSPVPAGPRRLPVNRGIEGIGILPRPSPLAGQIIAISERALTETRDIRGFLISGNRSAEFAVRRTNDFDVTDLAFLPNGDMLILERWFSAWRGVGMRIRRIELASIQAGATLDGPIVASADLGYQIDNMEGLAVHRETDGTIVLTIVSDDNFSFIQRTLLLQFAYRG